jgi:hypothetical protein
MPGIMHNRRTKALLLIGGALLIAGLGYRFMPTLQGLNTPNEEIAVKEKQLRKYARMVESGKALSEELEANGKVLRELQSGLLAGKTPSLAAVDVQNILQGIAAGSGVEIRKVRVLKPEEIEGTDYVSIPVQFTLSSTIRQLKGVLYGLETASRYLSVEKITMKASRSPRKRDDGIIQSDVTVSGKMKKG